MLIFPLVSFCFISLSFLLLLFLRLCFPSVVPTLMLIFLPFVSRSVQETAPAHEWVNHPRGVDIYVRCVTFLLLFLLR
ncbi:hypothetical protein C8J57DRAFT_1288118 [Mycena rebaudengoi]|nr:hypothetical protein C8J57DRAFT_1288118 [Mycena rebaudengoi]